MFDTFCVQVFEKRRDGCVKANLACGGEGVAHVFELYSHAAARGEIAIHHALAVQLQDAAVGKAAADGLAHLGHVGTAFGCEQ
ncbi:hypothetical protein D3C71_1642320 [compost metagenome]